jgi:microcompartment protein CcmL/EutN
VTCSIALLETVGLTPAMVAMDAMLKAASVRILQIELNDLYGVCVKVEGPTADVQSALAVGKQIAENMSERAVTTLITQVSPDAVAAIESKPETNPLIQQSVVFVATEDDATTSAKVTTMSKSNTIPAALGFLETQGFTAVFEAVDTACKAADVTVVAKEKLGGGYVTVVIQGELSAVSAAVEAGQQKVGNLGKLIAAHVIARPSPAVLSLLPKM